ncbi:MAG: hypothetical protein U0935_06630 [Pirellulales bacterium]
MSVREVAAASGVLVCLVIGAMLERDGGAHAAPPEVSFSLEVPGQPRLSSTAILAGVELTIVDPNGQRHVYTRRPELDTDDGQYRAYYSATARRYLRWPADHRGKMLLGNRSGDRLEWSPSRMEIRPSGRPPFTEPARPDGDREGLAGADDAAAPEGGPLAVLSGGADSATLARVDGRGRLEVYALVGDEWQPWRGGERLPLPPAAGVTLTRVAGEASPQVWAFDTAGRLGSLSANGRWRTSSAPPDARFLPGSRLTAVTSPTGLAIVAVDDGGRLWSVDVESGDWQVLEEREGLLVPGSAVQALSGSDPRVVLVDRRGHLLEYHVGARSARGPQRIASRLMPGSSVAVCDASDGGSTGEWQLAAIDAAGRLGIWTADRRSWHARVVRGLELAPGTPLSLVQRNGQTLVSAIRPDGIWASWEVTDDQAQLEPILAGFWGGGPVAEVSSGLFWCAVDRAGRLAVTRRRQARWETRLLGSSFLVAPQLAQRRLTSEPPLPPAQVVFVNRHSEELVVRLFDRTRAAVPQELVIAPGKSVRQRIERDSGAVLEETWLIPIPGGGFREEIQQIRLPPASRYTANVWVNRVTSVYFDRTTNKSSEPDEVNQSLVSLGVFPLPPGEELRDGDRIDVHREATARRNPGAVRLLEPDPQP